MVFAGSTGTVQAAPDVSLQVTHYSVSMGIDGIKRSTEFSERVLRRGETMWVERVMPAHAHPETTAQDPKAVKVVAKEHAHPDLTTATRWIERGADGKTRLRLVAAHDQVVVSIAPTEYGTVGFDGSWLAAYHLMDPALLKKLKASNTTAQGQWFESTTPGAPQVRVLWDAKLEVPLQVVTRSADGASSRTTTVRVLQGAEKAPWQATTTFATKDYSDFLD